MLDPEQNIGFLLKEVARQLRRNFTERVQHLGLSQAQWQALAHLSRQEGVRQVTLADSLEIQPITLARLIDRLEEAGLVARQPDPDDRRAVRLYLTPKAQPVVDRMWEIAAEVRELALTGLSEDQRQMFIEILKRMKRNLIEPADRPEAASEPTRKTTSNAGR